MQAQGTPNSSVATRLVAAIRIFARSAVGGRAKLMFAAILVLLIGANGLNVISSFVNRNLMSAIAERHIAAFVWQAQLTLAVFAGSTIVAVLARFAEERLGLLWREFMTERAIAVYMANGTYYRLARSGELANPDQRIAEDVRAFTATTLSFALMAMNSAFTILAFSGVLWSISPLLFVISVVYAALGSYLTIKLGRPLIRLNSDQLDYEASFRSALIHVRENAEGVMFGRRNEREASRLQERLDRLAENFRRITSVNRNVGFFSTGYNWLIQLIPILIIAPAFMRGEVEFGVITQSAIAFTTLVAAFSLVVTQFQSLSTYAAVVSRLGSLIDAFESEPPASAPGIGMVETAGRLAFENLTLLGLRPWRLPAERLVGRNSEAQANADRRVEPASGPCAFPCDGGRAGLGIRPDHPSACERCRLSAAAAIHASGQPSPDFAGRPAEVSDGRTDRRSFTVAWPRCVASAGRRTRPRAGLGRAPFLA